MSKSIGLVIASVIALFASLSGAAAQPSPDFARTYGTITTPDGTRLAYVAYQPKRTGRVPVIVTIDPYLGGGNPPEPLFLDQGYAFVAVSVRGTGCSSGTHKMLDRGEIGDGVAVVDWAARQPWSNGKVGMWGYSYPGMTALMVAARRPSSLRAIVVGSPAADLYADNIYPGGIFNVGLASHWTGRIQPRLAAIGVTARTAWGDTACAATVAVRPATTLYEDFAAHPTNDAYWHERAPGGGVARIAAPTMLVQTWQDQLIQTGDGLYRGLTVPRKIMLMPGGHSFGQVQTDVQATTLRWFAHWLKGAQNGVEREPPVDIVWEVPLSRPFPARWISHYASWPVAEERHLALRLAGDGSLNAASPSDDAPRRYTFPIGTEFVGSNAQFALAPDPDGALSYRTAPLTEDIVILGRAELSLSLASTATDTDFMVALHDIGPGGETRFLQRGFLRASMRDSSLDESALGGGTAPPGPLIPGQVYQVRLKFSPLGAVLRRGHRLELQIMSPSSVPQPDWALLPLGLAGRNTVHHGDATPSTLVLPLAPPMAVPAEAPLCGSQPYQPCRPAEPAAASGK